MKKYKHYSSGQVTLIVLLLASIAATIALATARNVTTDVQLSKVQEESVRAFSAAEAGIEKALYSWKSGQAIPQTITLDTGSADVSSTDVGGGQNFILPDPPTTSGATAFLWLTGHDGSGNFDEGSHYPGNKPVNLCWTNTNAAVEVIFFYKTAAGIYKTSRFAFDPSAGRRSSNNFSSPNFANCNSLRADLVNGAVISFPADTNVPLFLAVWVYYDSATLGMIADTGLTLPLQGKTITSTGTVAQGTDKVVSRRLRVFQTWDHPPAAFLEPVFSGGSIQNQ